MNLGRHHCKLGGVLRLDPRHQCLPKIEVGQEDRQTTKTSKVGLSYHRRHGSSPHYRQAWV